MNILSRVFWGAFLIVSFILAALSLIFIALIILTI